MNYIKVLQLSLIIVTFLIPNVTAFQDWTNITCIDGNANKFWNSTIDNQIRNRTETEYCNDLNCINGIGCIDPRETPGEVFFGNVLIFIMGAFLFGYLAIKITDNKHYPIRMLFFFMSILLIMSASLMGYTTMYVFGLTSLASPILYLFYSIIIIFSVLFLYFIKELITWAIVEMQNALKKKKPEAENMDVP